MAPARRTLVCLRALVFIGCAPAACHRATGIEGVIVDGNAAVSGAVVAAVAVPTKGAAKPALVARSNDRGRYTLAPLPPGRYAITATAKGHTAGLVLSVNVTAGAVARTDVHLGGEATHVTGTIVDGADGRPIEAGATVMFGRYSDVDGDLWTTNVEHGGYDVLLPRARYSVNANAPGHDSDARDVEAVKEFRLEHMLPRSEAAPPPRAVVDWLRKNAVRLSSVEPGSSFADLQPLAKAVAGARIVGLGEATHGTREFFRLKQRLIEWLVAEHGFNVVALEASMADAYDINEYVLEGRGDPEKALAGLDVWTWDTEEILELIKWMRRWNADSSHRRVAFYGFDMQSSPRAFRNVFDYVAQVAPAEVERLRKPLLALGSSVDAETIPAMSSADKGCLTAAVRSLVERFDAAHGSWVAHSSEAQWQLARMNARLLTEYLSEFAGDFAAGWPARDHALAENIEWILNNEHMPAKIVLWAHDLHVTRMNPAANHPLGEWLSRQWDTSYVNVGFAFGEGSFRARDAETHVLGSFTVAAPADYSLDRILFETKIPLFIIDLRDSPKTGAVAEWLTSPHSKRDIGGLFSTAWPSAMTAPRATVTKEYDLLAFVATTSAARALPESKEPPFTVETQLRDPDFDDPALRVWTTTPQLPAFGYAFSRATAEHGGCARLERLPEKQYGSNVGVFEQHIDASPFRGKRVQLTAQVRAGVRKGSSARLVLRANAPHTFAAAAVTLDHPIVENRWGQHSIELDVPPNATFVTVGGALVGDGAASFDHFRLVTIVKRSDGAGHHDVEAEDNSLAALIVDSKNSGEVWVDGMDSGWHTPTDRILLPPGEHTVEVRDPRGRSDRATVTIGSGETRRLLLGGDTQPH